MKKTIFILCLIILVGCKAKKVKPIEQIEPLEPKGRVELVKAEEPTIEKLSIPRVDFNLKNKAYELGKRMLLTCNTSKFRPYNESEAAASVIDNITEEKLSKICRKYRQRYGTFKDLELVAIYQNNIDNTTIFRYKALYTKKVANKELRVFMNDKNKVSAIKTLDWIDVYDNQ
jgi:hypothetical protein